MNYISIDIGSKNLHSAVCRNGVRQLVLTFSTVDALSIPSTAYVKDGMVLVGYEADLWSRYLPENTFELLDYLQGQFTTYLRSALRYVKELVIRQFGEEQYGLVYIIPEDFYDSDPRKRIVKETAKAIGFCDVKFKKHCASACAAYKFANEDKVLVCDYGYTNFKVSLLRYENDKMAFKRCKMSKSYCGMLADSTVRAIVEESSQINYLEEPFSLSQSKAIDDLCIRMKEELSYREKVQYPIPFTESICTINRDDFEQKIHAAIYETIKECSALVAEEGITWDCINAVIFTGGASLSPCISQIWKKYIAAYNNNTKLIMPTTSEQAIYGACFNAFAIGGSSVSNGTVEIEF